MNRDTLPINKRTVLGGQFWAVGAAVGVGLRGVALAVPLVAVGAYLVLEPALSSPDPAKPSRFLLRAE